MRVVHRVKKTIKHASGDLYSICTYMYLSGTVASYVEMLLYK